MDSPGWDPGSHQDSQIMGPKCHGEVTFLSLALLSLGSFHEGLVDVIGKLLVYIVFVLLAVLRNGRIFVKKQFWKSNSFIRK